MDTLRTPSALLSIFLCLLAVIIQESNGDTEIRSISFDPKEVLPGQSLCINAKYNVARNRSLYEISFETYTAKIFSYGKNGSLFYTNSTWGNRTDHINTKHNRFCFREVWKSDNNVPFRWRLRDTANSQAVYVFTLPIAIYPDHPPHIIFFFSEYEYDINFVVNAACYLERVRPYPSMSFFMDGVELETPYVSRTDVVLSDDQQYYDVQKRLTFTITEEMWLSHDNVKKPLTISCRSAFGQYNKTSFFTVKLREYVPPPTQSGKDDDYDSTYFPIFSDEDEDVSFFTKAPRAKQSPTPTKATTTTRKPTTRLLPATRPQPTRAPPATRPPPPTRPPAPTRPPPPTLAPTRPPPVTQPPRRVIVPTTTEEPDEYPEEVYYDYNVENYS